MQALRLMVIAALLSGCASLQGYKSQAATEAAGAMDSVRVDAEWALCKAISVGAWMRAYGGDGMRAQAWRVLCAQPATEDPAGSNIDGK